MFALAAIGVAACSNDDDNTVVNSKEQPLPLNITVSEKPLHNPDAPAQAPATRAAVTTTPTLSAFTLDYQYMRGEELTLLHGSNSASKDGSGHWSAGTWPDAGDYTEVHWYAHTDGTFITQSNPYINFTVEEQTNNQKDLLVATASGTKDGTGGNLSFTFDHACTALRFYVKKSTNLDDHTLTVTSINICNVVKDGKYFFDTNSWTLGTTRTNYTLYSGTPQTLNSTGWILLNANEDDYLFVIPQTLTAWNKTEDIKTTTQTYFKIECTVTKNSDDSDVFSGTTIIPFAATLTAGYQNDVKINIGMNSLYKAW